MRERAVVISFFPDRRFGFMRTESGKEVFFHVTGFPAGVKPRPGDRVTFELGEPVKLGRPKQAVNIQVESALISASSKARA